jgi:translocation and assembly module TamA
MLLPRSIPRLRPLSQPVRDALTGLGALLFATAVYAQDTKAVDYTVRIDAPGALEELLEDNLDLMRWRGNARVDLEQLQRLVKEAPEQARTLIATEVYYSP